MSGTFRNEQPSQEHRDIFVRPILVAMALIVLTIAAAAWIASTFPRPSKPSVTKPAKDLRSVTHYLTTEPQVDIAQYQKEKQQQLMSYGWTDASHTSAHIPIDRAMQMLASQSSGQEQHK
jgi:hypothetical protein